MIRRRAAGDRIGLRRADHAFDIDQGIAFGIAAAGRPTIKPHGHPGSRIRIRGGVKAGTALKLVGTEAAGQ